MIEKIVVFGIVVAIVIFLYCLFLAEIWYDCISVALDAMLYFCNDHDSYGPSDFKSQNFKIVLPIPRIKDVVDPKLYTMIKPYLKEALQKSTDFNPFLKHFIRE